ncbi:MAG: hypothetical protein ABIF77_00485 [bacterium]
MAFLRLNPEGESPQILQLNGQTLLISKNPPRPFNGNRWSYAPDAVILEQVTSLGSDSSEWFLFCNGKSRVQINSELQRTGVARLTDGAKIRIEGVGAYVFYSGQDSPDEFPAQAVCEA